MLPARHYHYCCFLCYYCGYYVYVSYHHYSTVALAVSNSALQTSSIFQMTCCYHDYSLPEIVVVAESKEPLAATTVWLYLVVFGCGLVHCVTLRLRFCRLCKSWVYNPVIYICCLKLL